jgi:Domain of unknown function (DUF4942)/Methyltransferase small domain
MQTLSNNSLIKQVKEANQDFEFYPTTSKIASVIYSHLQNRSDILDIGAGNGNFFRLIEKIDSAHNENDNYYDLRMGDKYAIEKSKILIDNMDKDIALVGSDFHNQTLIDKKVDVVFSNPPYSEVEQWATKIIRESNCKQAFIVMPVIKWEKSILIKSALKAREAISECIFEYDYRESEFRKARTVVGVYKIDFCKKYEREPDIDPFDLWFDEHFKILEEEKNESIQNRMQEQEKNSSLISGKNLIERLVLLYDEDMQQIQNVYKSISQIPAELLKELNISKETIMKSLQMKLKNTKNIYWEELFKNLDVIIEKLTHGSRKKILEKLTGSTNVDFTNSNAYAVICWALKNANAYFDSQLVNVYKNLTRAKNCLPYKSNHRFQADEFRYHDREKYKNYKLDYRIILQGNPNSLTDYWNEKPVDLNRYENRYTVNAIEDIFTIANNLGFELSLGFPVAGWEYGKERKLYMKNGEILTAIKIYKNGNFHFRLNVKFMKAFNVEAGRLLGWLKSPQQAADELNISPEDCLKFFKSNLSLDNSNIKLLN